MCATMVEPINAAELLRVEFDACAGVRAYMKDGSTRLVSSDEILTALQPLDPSRDELIESIQYAIGSLSMHIQAYHDGDHEPHQVPTELDELRRIQHHLEGSLISSKGEYVESSLRDAISSIVHQIGDGTSRAKA